MPFVLFFKNTHSVTVLVARPVYSPTGISRFSAVTLEVEGRVRITCRHPCGFSGSFHRRFCISIRGKPHGAGLEPLAKTKQPQQRCNSARVAPAALGSGLQGGSDGQTAVRLSNAVPAPAASCSCLSCPHALRRAELDTWGLC